MWRQDHVVVSCGYFKNSQAAASKRSPMCSLPFGIAGAAEHRDVTRIGLGHIVAVCPATKPIVVSRLMLVRDGSPLSNSTDHTTASIPFPYPFSLSKKAVRQATCG